MTTKTIGANLRKIRLEKGHKSYRRFAEENKITPSLYWSWENGSNITVNNLLKVAEALKIEPQELFQ